MRLQRPVVRGQDCRGGSKSATEPNHEKAEFGNNRPGVGASREGIVLRCASRLWRPCQRRWGQQLLHLSVQPILNKQQIDSEFSSGCLERNKFHSSRVYLSEGVQSLVIMVADARSAARHSFTCSRAK